MVLLVRPCGPFIYIDIFLFLDRLSQFVLWATLKTGPSTSRQDHALLGRSAVARPTASPPALIDGHCTHNGVFKTGSGAFQRAPLLNRLDRHSRSKRMPRMPRKLCCNWCWFDYHPFWKLLVQSSPKQVTPWYTPWYTLVLQLSVIFTENLANMDAK